MSPAEMAREHEKVWRLRARKASGEHGPYSAEVYTQAMYSAEAIGALAAQLEEWERTR